LLNKTRQSPPQARSCLRTHGIHAADTTCQVTQGSIVVRAPEQVSANLTDEVVILALSTEEYFGLAAVAARIWEVIDRPTPVTDIASRLVMEFEVDRDQCEHDLLVFLQQLADERLIEVRNAAAP
jgi:hypothetical protein